MEPKEFLSGVFSTLYKVDESAVSSLFDDEGKIKEDAKATIEGWDNERLKRLNEVNDNKFKRFQSETLTEYEKNQKKFFGVESDLKGEELWSEFKAKLVPDTSKGISEEAIKKHPLYLNAKEEEAAKWKSEIQKKDQEFSEFKSSVEIKELNNKIVAKAIPMFKGMKPKLDDDPQIAANQERLFIDLLLKQKFRLDENETPIPISGESEDLTDKTGHRVKFEDIVKDITHNYFGVQKADPRSGSGGGAGGSGGGADVPTPKSQDEYIKLKGLAEYSNTEKGVQLTKNWFDYKKANNL